MTNSSKDGEGKECTCKCHTRKGYICGWCDSKNEKPYQQEYATLENPCNCKCHRNGEEDACPKCQPPKSSECTHKWCRCMKCSYILDVENLLALQKKELLEAIGEDEGIEWNMGKDESRKNPYNSARNELRAELRAKIK